MKNDANETPLPIHKIPTVTTWRYQGERTSADNAYRVRFNVQVAPEPMPLAGNVWAYILPE